METNSICAWPYLPSDHSMREMTMIRITIALFTSVLILTGCQLRLAPPDDSDVNAAQTEMLEQYRDRGELLAKLIALTQDAAKQDGPLAAAVVKIQAQLASMPATPGTGGNPVDFERFEIGQRELGDAVSRLLIASDEDRRLHGDAGVRTLKRQLAVAERRIAVSRERYREAAGHYNSTLRVFPGSVAARALGLHERPLPGEPDRAVAHRKPRMDFDSLRGSLRV